MAQKKAAAAADEAQGFSKEELWARVERAKPAELDQLEADARSQGYADHGQMMLAIQAKRRGEDVKHRVNIAKVGRIDHQRAGHPVPEDLELNHPIQKAATERAERTRLANDESVIEELVKRGVARHEAAALLRNAREGKSFSGETVTGTVNITLPDPETGVA